MRCALNPIYDRVSRLQVALVQADREPQWMPGFSVRWTLADAKLPSRLSTVNSRGRLDREGAAAVVEMIEPLFYYSSMPDADVGGLPDEPMTALHLRLGSQAELLLAASGTSEMMQAARGLRLAALGIQRILMHPLFTDRSLQMDPSIPDPEMRHARLAELAVDVVTATDYLLSLLTAPSVTIPRLVLASEAGSCRRADYSGAETFDRLTRQRLDARGEAVRVGMRLLSGLYGDATSN